MTGSILVPSPGAPWFPDVNRFALTYNAYAREGGLVPVADHARSVRARWEKDSVLPGDLAALRSALFFEQRFWRHNDEEPLGHDREYVDTILSEMSRLTGGHIDGDPDPLP